MKRVLAALFIVALSAGVASATDVYQTEEAFLAAIGDAPFLLEDFDEYTYGSYQQPTLDIGPENGFSATISAAQGLWSGDGNMSTNNAGDPIVVDFTGEPCFFVGGEFFGSDINGFYIPGDVILTLSDGTVETYAPVDATEFRGFVSDVAIVSISIDSPDDDGTNRWAAMDHFYLGGEGGDTPGVPATSTVGIVVLMITFMAIGTFLLRRRTA